MKILKTLKCRFAIGLICCLIVFSGDVCLNGQSGRHYDGLSRGMEQAIRLYHEGQDNEAMDRFMDILVKGTPSEKSLANEYISKITLRMNSGISYPGEKSSKPKSFSKRVYENKDVRETKISRGDKPYAPVKVRDNFSAAYKSEDRRELVNEKIKEKISEMRKDILLRLNKSKAVKIYMEKNLPKAISINTRHLFSKSTHFKSGSVKILSDIVGLLFTMGKAHCLVLPEGAIIGDTKIMSIRRALAVNSYLVERGISSSRVDVNLIGSDVQLSSNIRNIKGLAIVFDHDTDFNLEPPKKGKENAPQISLGIFPTVIAPYKNEGAIIEFSVFKALYGSVTWKFQIFRLMPDKSAIPVRKITGHGAQCHQSFWNGRKDFFGQAYPAGQYMFVLSAVNADGKETVMRKLLLLKAKPGVKKSAKIKSKVLSRKNVKKRLPLKKSNKTKSKKRYSSKSGKKSFPKTALSARAKTMKAAETAPVSPEKQTEIAGHVSYKIYFKSGSSVITSNSEKRLMQVADTMNYYPLARLRLTGYAYSGEPNSEAVAQNRADFVLSQLSIKYGISKSRMDVSSRIAEVPKSIVEIKMLGNE